MQPGQEVLLFDGSEFEYLASITEVTKKNVTVEIKTKTQSDVESPLDIHLGR
ncbi:ribosomal RNA small subunit methyltransferase E [Vibrio sp. JCM 19236]|nr:ribosomal RNA small subunit methyltransferase E [Vibrio sp. JCM 19236]